METGENNADKHTVRAADQRGGTSLLVVGIVAGVISALGYTLTNIFLRAVADLDPIFVSWVKSWPTVCFSGPWLLLNYWRGEPVLPPRRIIAVLIGAGIVGQLGGNVLFQWALGVLGLALSVPVCMGAIIFFSAVLARAWLREPVSWQAFLSMLVLIVAIWVLSLGASDAFQAVAQQAANPWLIAAGLLAALASGFAYAVLGVAIRFGVVGNSTIPATTFLITLVGLVLLGAITCWRLPLAVVGATTALDWSMMILAGIANLAAFLALTRAYQVATVVFVNALNATQVAMAAFAGVLLFREPLTIVLVVGVACTVLGVLFTPKDTDHLPKDLTNVLGVQNERNRASSAASESSSQVSNASSDSRSTAADIARSSSSAAEPPT